MSWGDSHKSSSRRQHAEGAASNVQLQQQVQQHRQTEWLDYCAALREAIRRFESDLNSSSERDLEAAVAACETAEAALQRLEREARGPTGTFAFAEYAQQQRAEFENVRMHFSRVTQRWQRQQLLRSSTHSTGVATAQVLGKSGSARAAVAAQPGNHLASNQIGGKYNLSGSDGMDLESVATHLKSEQALKESNELAGECEEVGRAVMQKLRVQRETIIHSRGLAEETQESLAGTREVLKSMLRGTYLTKVVLSSIIVCLIVAILCVLVHIVSRFFPRLH